MIRSVSRLSRTRGKRWSLSHLPLRARRWAAAAVLLTALTGATGLPAVARAATATGSTSLATGPSLPLYGQQWQPWGPDNLGTSSSSIAGYGCALTAAAMLLQIYGVPTNPGALNQWLTGNQGYVDQDLLVWGAVAQAAQAAGVSVSYLGWQPYSTTAVDSSLAAGNPVIAQVSLDGNMHFVLLTGVSADGTLWINDPWFADHTTFQSRYGDPATQIQSIRLYSGTPVAPAQLTSMSPGGSETVNAPSGGLGTDTSGAQVLVVPDTTATTDWATGTPAVASSWSSQLIAFTAPDPLTAGSVVVETGTGEPNFWFPFTVPGQAAVGLSSLSPATGPATGGTPVTILGSGFEAPVWVTFGSAPATSVTVASPTEVEAVSPSGSGSQEVQLGDWMGSSATATSSSFVYTGGPSAAAYLGLAPGRICDTRPGNPSSLTGGAAQCDNTPLTAGSALTVQVAGLAGVPASGASAVVLNLTVTDPASAGYLSVYPAGQTPPLSSNLNFQAGQTVANLTEVGLSSQGQIAMVTDATSAQLVVDVEGYVAASSTAGLGLYDPLQPARICDTRSGVGAKDQCTGKTIGPGSTLAVQVAGLGGVPAGAEAVALNVTATDTSSAGYLTVFPSGQPPTASNLNWGPGETVANLVIASLNSTGGLTLYNYQGTADVVVDVMGYYTAAGGSGSQFNPISTPTRICDTRTTSSPANQCTGRTMAADSTLAIQVTGLAGVPADAKAVVLNVTATDTSASGYLTVFAAGTPPLASNLNWTAGMTVPNLVVADLNSAGGITIYNYQGTADVVVDVLGWYS